VERRASGSGLIEKGPTSPGGRRSTQCEEEGREERGTGSIDCPETLRSETDQKLGFSEEK